MQTITTVVLSASNDKGSRVKAKTATGIVRSVPYDYQLDHAQNHMEAAKALAKELGWKGKFQGGSTKDGMCFTIECESFSFTL